MPYPGLTLAHLNRAEVEAYLKRAGQDAATATETVLDNLGLRAGETLFNGAALLFASGPQRWVVGSRVQCARFLGVMPCHLSTCRG